MNPPFPATRAAWRLSVLLGLLLAAGDPVQASDRLLFQEGQASAPADGRLLYGEQHWLRLREDRLHERLVLYRCPDGTPFARKRVDYGTSAQAPAFALEDARSGYREGLRRQPEAALYVRESARAAEQARAVAGTGLVADAGFDEFVRVHWAALVAGKRLPLAFAIPARLRSLPFTLQRTNAAPRIGGERAHVFRLRLDGWLGAFAPRIEVAYGERSRRLLRFEGLSNLRDDGGHSQWQARIEFPLAPRSVAPQDWARAAALPLSGCGSGRRADAADTADAGAVGGK